MAAGGGIICAHSGGRVLEGSVGVQRTEMVVLMKMSTSCPAAGSCGQWQGDDAEGGGPLFPLLCAVWVMAMGVTRQGVGEDGRWVSQLLCSMSSCGCW